MHTVFYETQDIFQGHRKYKNVDFKGILKDILCQVARWQNVWVYIAHTNYVWSLAYWINFILMLDTKFMYAFATDIISLCPDYVVYSPQFWT